MAKKKTNKKKALTKMEILKGVIMVALFIAFLVYIESWWGLIALPFVIDVYFTRKINWSWWKELENPLTRLVMSWVDAIVFALVAVYFVNIYFFQNYTIPSSSLEKSLLVGDYLAVSKMSYGARVPQTPLHMPLCQHTLPFNIGKSYIDAVQWDYKRIHAQRVPLNDIVVFNYPAGDTIMTSEPFQTQYYDFCYRYGWDEYIKMYGLEPTAAGSQVFRNGMVVSLDALSPQEQRAVYQEIYALGRNFIEMHANEVGDIDWRPVDRRENYVKRCVGTPGQTLQIKDKIIYLDGKANKTPDEAQFMYIVFYKQEIPEELAHELGLSRADLYGDNGSGGLYADFASHAGVMPLTQTAKKALESHAELIDSIVPYKNVADYMLYPQNMNHHWSQDNYGPLWIPAKGKQIPGGLTLQNLPIYERLIKVYEGNTLEVTADGKILINGKEAQNYTFKMDYYWMMGDNRHCSADSRYWGFVPEDHVVGKPTLIWMSLDPDRGIFDGGIRWNRLFRWVDNIK